MADGKIIDVEAIGREGVARAVVLHGSQLEPPQPFVGFPMHTMQSASVTDCIRSHSAAALAVNVPGST